MINVYGAAAWSVMRRNIMTWARWGAGNGMPGLRGPFRLLCRKAWRTRYSSSEVASLHHTLLRTLHYSSSYKYNATRYMYSPPSLSTLLTISGYRLTCSHRLHRRVYARFPPSPSAPHTSAVIFQDTPESCRQLTSLPFSSLCL